MGKILQIQVRAWTYDENEVTAAWPRAAWAWYGWGRAHRAMGREDLARYAFGKAAELSPDDSRYHLALNRKRGLFERLKGFFGQT